MAHLGLPVRQAADFPVIALVALLAFAALGALGALACGCSEYQQFGKTTTNNNSWYHQ